MDHPLVAGKVTVSKQTVGNVHLKAVTDPMYSPSFRVRKGVITPHRLYGSLTAHYEV
jgi:hypothetical protein